MKKLLSALMSLSLLAGAAAMPAAAAETYSMGDVNMDGTVDVVDAAEILVEVVLSFSTPEKCNFTDEQLMLADVYQYNGTEYGVDLADAVTVLQYYVCNLTLGNSMSFEEFWADAGAYHDAQQSENFDESHQQMVQEGKEAISDVHYEKFNS